MTTVLVTWPKLTNQNEEAFCICSSSKSMAKIAQPKKRICINNISRFLIGQFWSRDKNPATWLVDFANYRFRGKIKRKQKHLKKIAFIRKYWVLILSRDENGPIRKWKTFLSHFERVDGKNGQRCKSKIACFLIGQVWSPDQNLSTWSLEFELLPSKQSETKKIASSWKY